MVVSLVSEGDGMDSVDFVDVKEAALPATPGSDSDAAKPKDEKSGAAAGAVAMALTTTLALGITTVLATTTHGTRW